MTRTRLVRLVGLFFAAAVAACEGGPLPPEGGAVATVEITPPSPTVETGGSLQLSATLRDAEGNVLDGRSLYWSSEDEAVVQVSATGMLTAGTPGTARVAASAEGKSAVATVTVGPPSVASVVVAPAQVRVPVLTTLQLQATAYDGSGRVLSGRQVTWATSDATVVTVDAAGTIRSLRPGTAEVTATSEGRVGRSAVTVVSGAVASISVEPAATTFTAVGETKQLTAVARDAAGNVIPGLTFVWSSSAPAVAGVTQAGLVAAAGNGSATIAAEAGGVRGTAQITVLVASPPPPPPSPAPVASVTVSPATGEVVVGGTLQLTATPRDAAGNPLAGRTITWQSSAPLVASVDGSGRVTALVPGEATITATSEGKSGTARITVPVLPPPPPAPVASVTVSPSVAEITVGDSRQLTATPRDADGNPLTGRTITWQSSAPLVAAVDGSGRVTALLPGEATITATSEGKSGTARITVPAPPPAPVATVTVTPSTAEVEVGGAQQLAATLRDAAGNTLTGRTVTWQSSAPGIAAVDGSGRVTALAPGEATITATSEGKSGTARITVPTPPPAPVASVTVSPSTGEITVGGTLQLTATPRDAAGNPLTGRTITWQSSAPAVATVDGSGRVTAVAPGTATISATAEGKTGTAAVRVSAPPPAPVASVTVTPSWVVLEEDDEVKLTATVRDAAGNVLTGRTVRWTSSNPERVSVDQNGVVRGRREGNPWITITAEVEGVTGTARVRVEDD
jgi:uncharacterized protein YjdB